MTLPRVLLTLSGFISVVSGLIVVGLLTWALVWWLRRPGPATVKLTAAVTVAIAAARVAQFAALHSSAILLAIVLPAVVLWRGARGPQGPKPGEGGPVPVGGVGGLPRAAVGVVVVPPRPPASAGAP